MDKVVWRSALRTSTCCLQSEDVTRIGADKTICRSMLKEQTQIVSESGCQQTKFYSLLKMCSRAAKFGHEGEFLDFLEKFQKLRILLMDEFGRSNEVLETFE